MAKKELQELENAETISENIDARKGAIYGYDLENTQWRRLAVDPSGQVKLDPTGLDARFLQLDQTTPQALTYGALLRYVATQEYVQSRGLQLITNGSGLEGDNSNFTSFTFDPIETHGGKGSFKTGVYNAAFNNDEFIPVDVIKTYVMDLWSKSTIHAVGAHHYFGINCFDIDDNSVAPQFYMKFTGSTDTTLAADLNPGDTVVHLTNATGWKNTSGADASRNFVWYGYTNAQGYTYPDYTYSRLTSYYYSSNSTLGAWSASGISGNDITLRVAWIGPKILAGTAIRNLATGATYKYVAASNVDVPAAWTEYSGYIGGIDTNGVNSNTLFPYGTAYIKLVFLLNRDVAGNTVNVSDLSFKITETNFLANVGIRVASPTAYLHIKAGTATAGTAPLKFTPTTVGVFLGTPEVGAVEPEVDNLWYTITTGSARKGIVFNNGANLTSGRIPAATTNGRLTDGPTPVADSTYNVDGSAAGTVSSFTTVKGLITAITTR